MVPQGGVDAVVGGADVDTIKRVLDEGCLSDVRHLNSPVYVFQENILSVVENRLVLEFPPRSEAVLALLNHINKCSPILYFDWF